MKRAVDEDRERGLIPFFVIATLGTTASLAFDNILELGPICQKENVIENDDIFDNNIPMLIYIDTTIKYSFVCFFAETTTKTKSNRVSE